MEDEEKILNEDQYEDTDDSDDMDNSGDNDMSPREKELYEKNLELIALINKNKAIDKKKSPNKSDNIRETAEKLFQEMKFYEKIEVSGEDKEKIEDLVLKGVSRDIAYEVIKKQDTTYSQREALNKMSIKGKAPISDTSVLSDEAYMKLGTKERTLYEKAMFTKYGEIKTMG